MIAEVPVQIDTPLTFEPIKPQTTETRRPRIAKNFKGTQIETGTVFVSPDSHGFSLDPNGPARRIAEYRQRAIDQALEGEHTCHFCDQRPKEIARNEFFLATYSFYPSAHEQAATTFLSSALTQLRQRIRIVHESHEGTSPIPEQSVSLA